MSDQRTKSSSQEFSSPKCSSKKNNNSDSTKTSVIPATPLSAAGVSCGERKSSGEKLHWTEIRRMRYSREVALRVRDSRAATRVFNNARSQFLDAANELFLAKKRLALSKDLCECHKNQEAFATSTFSLSWDTEGGNNGTSGNDGTEFQETNPPKVSDINDLYAELERSRETKADEGSETGDMQDSSEDDRKMPAV